MESGTVRRLAAALCTAIALAATPIHDAAAEQLRVWTWMNLEGKSGRERVMKELVDSFEAANPGAEIAVETQDYKTMTEKFLAAHQTGTAPDLIWIYAARLHDVIAEGALANLNDLFVRDWSAEEIADIDGPLWRYGATGDGQYAITQTPTMICFFYRKDLFAEAGIDPKALTTWDSLFDAAKKLTRTDANGNVIQWGLGQSFSGPAPVAPIVFSVLLEQNGTLFDSALRAAWANPAGVKGLQLQVDSIRKYKITPENAVNMLGDEMFDQFGAGRYAIIRGASTRIPVAAAALGPGKVGYLPTPSFTDGKNSPSEVGGWSIGVWSGSERKELAARFLEYVTSGDADSLWLTKAGQMPIRRSTTAANTAFFENPENEYLAQATADLREHGWLPPRGSGAGWDEGLNSALQDVMTNGTDPQTALEKAERAFNRANRR